MAKTREEIRRRENEYWAKNKDKKKAKDRRYYLKNRKKLITKANEWYEKNKQRALYIKKASFARSKLDDVGMTADLVQSVYEDNIKKYGTLTCVICHKRIEFGDDTLEHNVPLCRGGTHEYSNLGVAHLACNSRKHDKTLKEMKNTRR